MAKVRASFSTCSKPQPSASRVRHSAAIVEQEVSPSLATTSCRMKSAAVLWNAYKFRDWLETLNSGERLTGNNILRNKYIVTQLHKKRFTICDGTELLGVLIENEMKRCLK